MYMQRYIFDYHQVSRTSGFIPLGIRSGTIINAVLFHAAAYSSIHHPQETAKNLFMDGHVKALKPFQTIAPINMWGYFKDNQASDGPNCDPNNNGSVNCDTPAPAARTDLRKLDIIHQ